MISRIHEILNGYKPRPPPFILLEKKEDLNKLNYDKLNDNVYNNIKVFIGCEDSLEEMFFTENILTPYGNGNNYDYPLIKQFNTNKPKTFDNNTEVIRFSIQMILLLQIGINKYFSNQ